MKNPTGVKFDEEKIRSLPTLEEVEKEIFSEEELREMAGKPWLSCIHCGMRDYDYDLAKTDPCEGCGGKRFQLYQPVERMEVTISTGGEKCTSPETPSKRSRVGNVVRNTARRLRAFVRGAGPR